MRKTKKRILLIGGGFAGLNFARQLYRSRDYEITLVDKNNYNYFTPLLYQVATSFLEPASISYPFRKLLRKTNIRFRMGAVVKADPVQHTVTLNDGAVLPYDYLVFAAGTKTNFFENESARRHAFPLKGVDDALFMRNELIRGLERASIETNPVLRKRMLTTVIAGGGPTGVEMAGMLAELRKFMLSKDYPEIDPQETAIYIVDASPNLLAPMSDKSHEQAYRTLEKLGIIIKLNTRVLKFEHGQVHLSTGEVIGAHSLIWAAGVTAEVIDGVAPQALGRGNRMITDAMSRVQGYEDVFAIGDISLQLTDKDYPNGHPQLAQPAIQQGKTLGRNFKRLARGRSMQPFEYFDRGEMAIIGRRTAMADLFKHRLHVGGMLGLFSWLFIHIASLVNYNNMIRTFYSWLVAYSTRDQVLRMIFRSESQDHRS